MSTEGFNGEFAVTFFNPDTKKHEDLAWTDAFGYYVDEFNVLPSREFFERLEAFLKSYRMVYKNEHSLVQNKIVSLLSKTAETFDSSAMPPEQGRHAQEEKGTSQYREKSDLGYDAIDSSAMSPEQDQQEQEEKRSSRHREKPGYAAIDSSTMFPKKGRNQQEEKRTERYKDDFFLQKSRKEQDATLHPYKSKRSRSLGR